MPLPRGDTAHILMISTCGTASPPSLPRRGWSRLDDDAAHRTAIATWTKFGLVAPAMAHALSPRAGRPRNGLFSRADRIRHALRPTPELRHQRGALDAEQPCRGLLVALGATERLGDQAVLELLHGGIEVEAGLADDDARGPVLGDERPDGGREM